MAFIRYEYCSVCEKETEHINLNCSSCQERERRLFIGQWNALNVDEKIQDLRKRIEKLERGPMRF